MISNPVQLVVLADDLTGANDAGVQFAVSAIRSVVFADWKATVFEGGYPVVVINTETRHLSPTEAGDRIRELTLRARAAGVPRFYKKTDSTLRGNIGAELQALMEASGASFLPFVPALPALGRVTREGMHYVHGTPIGESAFARDPLHPIRTSVVAKVLAPHLRFPICHLKPGEAAMPSFHGVGVHDCESEEDLAQIAKSLVAPNPLMVFSGSVALIRHLVNYLAIPSDAPEKPEVHLPILLVNGSLHERALEQISKGSSYFSKLQLRPDELIGEQARITIPAGGGNLMLFSISERSQLESFRSAAARGGLTDRQLHLRIAERTGQIVHEILSTGVFRTVVVFGGDTLAGIARASRWRSFIPLGEIEPGISLTHPQGNNLAVFSKAGGFGDVEVVSRIVRHVQERAKQNRT